jgi:hypothetical protein
VGHLRHVCVTHTCATATSVRHCHKFRVKKKEFSCQKKKECVSCLRHSDGAPVKPFSMDPKRLWGSSLKTPLKDPDPETYAWSAYTHATDLQDCHQGCISMTSPRAKLVSKETYTSVKRDLHQRQKIPRVHLFVLPHMTHVSSSSYDTCILLLISMT